MNTHIPSAKSYLLVFAALLVLTGTTVGVSFIELGEWNVIVALAIAIIKASLVVLIFMNVRNSSSLTKLFVVAGLVWLSVLIALTLADYWTRQWTYEAQPW
jgi:cytochrome c oxidase subunit 4